MKLDKYNLRQLLDLKADVETVMEAKKQEAIQDARDEMNATAERIARKYGLASVEIRSPNGKARRKSMKASTKYRDPQTGVVWAGRGRMPHNFNRARAVEL